VQTWVQQQRLSLSAVVEAFDTFEGLRRPAQPALAAREIRAKHLPAYTVGRRALCTIHMALARAGVVGIHMLYQMSELKLSSRCPSGEAHDLERYGPAWATITCRRGSVGALCSASTGRS
jgi:hypothetical protein